MNFQHLGSCESYADRGLSLKQLAAAVVCGFIGCVFMIAGCQSSPTRVYEKSDVDLSLLRKRSKDPIRITPETVIIDARPSFDYAVAHIPGSINLNWLDFSDRATGYEGRISKDLDRHVRRLALYGVSPDAPVVVVGNGKGGSGEEGRLAWTLLYLGLSDVQIADVDALRMRFSNEVPPPRENAKPWNLSLREKISASREEVLSAVVKKSGVPTHIIDVRTQKEYFSKTDSLQYEIPDLGAVNIPWTNFLTDEGRPNFNIKKELKAIHIGSNDRIIVLSQRGVRSAAVTFALLSVGFTNVANFAGGYQELLKSSSRRN